MIDHFASIECRLKKRGWKKVGFNALAIVIACPCVCHATTRCRSGVRRHDPGANREVVRY
jgi:hypothetical protein